MPPAILAVKLYAPPPPPKVSPRPRLVEQLDATLQRKLALVSAPAGFGKTTLIGEWRSGCGRPVAWLSLDESDSDLTGFLTYVVAALQTIAPGIGRGALAMLQAAQPPPPETILTALLNDAAAVPGHFFLALDDYHAIASQPVHAALAFMVERLPPRMHLLIASREDPPLPLARLRARGQLTELRAADLRFTTSEAADFLNRVMGLDLPAEQIAALESRTEGWIAGLQLAALSMHSLQDTAGFIRSFTGSHRFVLDYLVEEVLARRPEGVRSFLLQTSILERLSGPLCDAVTGREGGQAMLEDLERANLFVVPLDDRRRWYRYHHLFADVLQARLMASQPEAIPELHRRASTWYERDGSPPDAIRHALAAGDFERAAGLVEAAWSAMDQSYQSAAWLGWTRALPEALLQNRPVLSAGYAWALLDTGELEAGEARLQLAERGLDLPADQIVVVDREQFRSLPATIAAARAYRSLALSDIPGTIRCARQALELAPAGDQVRRIQAASLLGLAQYANGELREAERSLAGFHAHLREIGDRQTLVGITFLLADIRSALGRLHEAESLYQHTLRLAAAWGEPMPLGSADLHRGLADLYVEWNDLEAAARYLQTGRELGEHTALPNWPQRLGISQARLQEAGGDLDGALALLEQAERTYIRAPLPEVRPAAALIAQAWLRQGRTAEALAWARAHGLSPEDELSFGREFEHLTLARALIAEAGNDPRSASLDQAARLLERLLEAAEAGGRGGSAIQVRLLLALACHAGGQTPAALAHLERALALAEPEGYVRTFVDQGEALRGLLESYAQDREHPSSGYAARLLAGFSQPAAFSHPAVFSPPAGSSPPAALPGSGVDRRKAGLVEPLSARELEVLRLLRSELNGPEIAGQLVVSLNTLRSHTKNIFRKLGVGSRRAAVRRGEELDLF